MSESVWKIDDCLHQVLGDFERPEWLDVPTSVQAMANFKRRCGGDLAAGVEAFVAEHGSQYRRMDEGEDWMPGDVIIGRTREYEFVSARVHESHLPMIRTEIGFDYAKFTEVISAWRLK